MSEIIKITSPVEVKNRIPSAPKTQSSGFVFDITEPDGLTEENLPILKTEEENPRQELLKHLSKELHLPLLEQTKAGTEGIRKLILYAKLFQVASGIITEDFLTEFFVLPKELLGELKGLDQGASIFKGDFFEVIRTLAKNDNLPELKPFILKILKAFDSYVSKDISLKFIEINTVNLTKDLMLTDGQVVEKLLHEFQTLVLKDDFEEISSFLKNQLVPTLRSISQNYPPADKVQDGILSIIHYIVRYGKSDPQVLEKAFDEFADELRPLFPHLTDEDVIDMKETLLKNGQLLREEINLPENRSYNKEGKDLASLLEKALDKESPAKINLAARELLQHLVQNESPMQPYLHFLIPLRFRHEDTYGEFFIDKNCNKRKGSAKKAVNIFFTIQSDFYGTFEVDLLAKDNFIELDIKCPEDLIKDVNNMKKLIQGSIESVGYRLSTYQVGEYQDSTSILKRFPELMDRRSGVDVRV